jgi:cell division protease FtsH
VTQQLPHGERYLESRSSLLASMCVLLGGRVAEELQLARVSSRAAPDLERVTRLARRMVTEWGMSDRLGPALPREPSDATVEEIDGEVRRIVLECRDRTRRMLEERAEALGRVAEALLAQETLLGSQVASLIEADSRPRVLTPGG